MKIVKSAAPVLAVASVLVACGGVDREGTRDLFVEQLQDAGFDADGDCVDSVLDEYSDDELESANDDPESAIAQEIGAQLIECVDITGGDG